MRWLSFGPLLVNASANRDRDYPVGLAEPKPLRLTGAPAAWGPTGVRPGFDRGSTGVRPGFDRGQTGVRPGFDRGQTRVRPGSDQGSTGVRPGFDQGLTLV